MKLDVVSPVASRDVHALAEIGSPTSDASATPLRDLPDLHPIHSPSHSATAKAVRASTKDKALAHAAAEMEAVFVRHLLEAAKLGGSSSSSGYGSMAVDALAAGIQKGGGIGLARAIEDAVTPRHPTVPRPLPANGTNRE